MKNSMKKIVLSLVSIAILSCFSGCINLRTDDSLYNKIDTDGDSVYDENDAFPNDPAASVDSDDDGYPDDWNSGKNQDDSITNLSIDAFSDDPAASLDTDKDAYPDCWNPRKDQSDSTSIPPLELDEFPDDPKAHKDTDGDGLADYYDINDFVDLSINIELEKFKVTDKVDILRWAQVYFDIYINNEKIKRINNNGRCWKVWLNQIKTISHDLISYDIPDNTLNQFTDIEIIMYDYDFIGTDDIIDISYKSGKKTLFLRFDNIANTISHDGITNGDKGTLWYDITFTESDIPDIETYNKTYRWKFNNKYWKLFIKIPLNVYRIYKESNIIRNPRSDDEMAAFVTSDDKVINDLAYELLSYAKNENYNTETTVNFILRFVQKNIKYVIDVESKGIDEYWRIPIETLVEQEGDCEDTSLLFAAIMDALGYDTILLLYNVEQEGKELGHLAVGIHLEENHGSYIEDNIGKRYYYCETTTVSFVVGQLPLNIEGEPEKIIHI